jgi:two-component system response regulator AtoC
MLSALLVDDEALSLRPLARLLEEEGFSVSTASNLKEAQARLKSRVPDLLLLDLMLPDGSGLEFLKELEPGADMEVVLMTGFASVDTAIEALRIGASDYMTKPVDVARLKTILTNVKRTRDLKEEINTLRDKLRKLGQFGPILGSSPAMQRVYDQITRVAPTEATVLVTGESGTGKELVAQALYGLSKRRKQPYLPMNCGAISPTLIESELFGHEEGSFTGASRMHKGYFERANGGIIFLDEITEMPAELQVKLLRVLETGSFLRIGGDKEVKVDVRVLAATNRKPEEALADGKLREDLLYRLNVFRIEIPPLRERGDDIELLAEHFLDQLNKAEGTRKKFSSSALERLRAYNWPGNVREMKNVIHRSFILANDEITPDLLLPVQVSAAPMGPKLFFDVGISMAEAQRRLITATLESYGGDKKMAAAVLGISLRTLYNRLDAYKAADAYKASAQGNFTDPEATEMVVTDGSPDAATDAASGDQESK